MSTLNFAAPWVNPAPASDGRTTMTVVILGPAWPATSRTTAVRSADVREMASWLAANALRANPRDSWPAGTDFVPLGAGAGGRPDTAG